MGIKGLQWHPLERYSHCIHKVMAALDAGARSFQGQAINSEVLIKEGLMLNYWLLIDSERGETLHLMETLLRFPTDSSNKIVTQ